MRRAVRTEKKPWVAAGRGLDQRQPVAFALEHRQAVVMRPDAARKDRIAVVQQMVGRDRGGSEFVRILNILRSLQRGDVFEHDLELGEVAAQRDQLGIDEYCLPVEQVDFRTGHLAMYQQWHRLTLHRLQHLVGAAQIRDTGRAVGGCAGGVQLERHDARGRSRRLGVFRAPDLIRIEVVGQVQGHERLERHAVGHHRTDAPRIVQGLRHRGDGRLEVGHDHGPGELRRRVRDHGSQGFAVADMQVPIIGTDQCQCVDRVSESWLVHGGAGRRGRGCQAVAGGADR